MNIRITLAVYEDDTENGGLTEEADNRLCDALISAGFDIVSGPDTVD